MKNEAYAILYDKGDLFQTMFKTKKEAIQEAKWEWVGKKKMQLLRSSKR